MESLQTDETCRLFAMFGLYLAAAVLNPADARLARLSGQIVAAERGFQRDGYDRPEYGWLLGATFFDQRHELWRRLADDILAAAMIAAPDIAHLAEMKARMV